MEASIPGYESDTIPGDLADIEYPCEVCGRESGPYSGRGRKPKKCPEHRAQKTPAGTRVKGQNASLAAQATEALMQLNNFAAIGLLVTQLHATGAKLREASDDRFRESVYNALLLDPDLCRWICRGGVRSGKVALLLAYVMLGASVMPTAIVELREKKEVREARKAEEEREAQETLEATQSWAVA